MVHKSINLESKLYLSSFNSGKNKNRKIRTIFITNGQFSASFLGVNNFFIYFISLLKILSGFLRFCCLQQ